MLGRMSTHEALTADRIREIFSTQPFDEAAVDRAVAYYADDVVFVDPIQTLHGRAAFVEMNKRLLGRVRELRFDVDAVTVDAENVFLAWRMHVAMKKPAKVISIDGVTHCKVRDGKITAHRDHWDLVGSMVGTIPVVGPAYRAIVAKLG
jgi:limonene-1,2-epoxide hydrolase